ncbi:hypothetical protein [Proteus phage 2]|nr:hypothetical protein [Proteus phage 1]QNN97925.1 hypothetical protein [Proteus phage 2]QOC55032.1 hypothetical protein [Proteus phage M4H10_20]
MLGKSKLEDAVLDAIIEDPAKLEEQLDFLAAVEDYSEEDYEAGEQLKQEVIEGLNQIDQIKTHLRSLLQEVRYDIENVEVDNYINHTCEFIPYHTSETWKRLEPGDGVRTTYSQCPLCGEKKVTEKII